jgi:hypothetical protein
LITSRLQRSPSGGEGTVNGVETGSILMPSAHQIADMVPVTACRGVSAARRECRRREGERDHELVHAFSLEDRQRHRSGIGDDPDIRSPVANDCPIVRP